MGGHSGLLQFESITRRFGGTLALDAVSLNLSNGQILALLGENGAGTSTLIKILPGIHQPDGGRIRVNDAPYQHHAANFGTHQVVGQGDT